MVNSLTAGHQSNPQVMADALGSFVVAWNHDENWDGQAEVRAQRFSAAGAKLGPELQVNSTTVGDQRIATLTVNSLGGFQVQWTSEGELGSKYYQRLYDAAGNPLGDEMPVPGLP